MLNDDRCTSPLRSADEPNGSFIEASTAKRTFGKRPSFNHLIGRAF
jgi:hypothetical protein